MATQPAIGTDNMNHSSHLLRIFSIKLKKLPVIVIMQIINTQLCLTYFSVDQLDGFSTLVFWQLCHFVYPNAWIHTMYIFDNMQFILQSYTLYVICWERRCCGKGKAILVQSLLVKNHIKTRYLSVRKRESTWRGRRLMVHIYIMKIVRCVTSSCYICLTWTAMNRDNQYFIRIKTGWKQHK